IPPDPLRLPTPAPSAAPPAETINAQSPTKWSPRRRRRSQRFPRPLAKDRHGHPAGRVQDAAAADGSAKIDAAGGDIHGATGADRGSDVGAAAENEQRGADTDGD